MSQHLNRTQDCKMKLLVPEEIRQSLKSFRILENLTCCLAQITHLIFSHYLLMLMQGVFCNYASSFVKSLYTALFIDILFLPCFPFAVVSNVWKATKRYVPTIIKPYFRFHTCMSKNDVNQISIHSRNPEGWEVLAKNSETKQHCYSVHAVTRHGG